MSVEVVPPAVKDSLDLSVKDGELRKILYRQRIKLDEPVLLSIKINDTDKVINYNIPTISPPVDVPQTQKSFAEEIKVFLKNAEKDEDKNTEYKLLTNLYQSSDDGWNPNVSDDSQPMINCVYIFDIPGQDTTLSFKSGVICFPCRPR